MSISAVLLLNKHVIGFFKNITERKMAEEALKISEELFRGVFTHMKEALAYCEMHYENGQSRKTGLIWQLMTVITL